MTMLLSAGALVWLYVTGGLALAAIVVLAFLVGRGIRNHRKGRASGPDWQFAVGYSAIIALWAGGLISGLIIYAGMTASAINRDLTGQGYMVTSIRGSSSTDAPIVTVSVNGKGLQQVRVYRSGPTGQWHPYTLCPVGLKGQVTTDNCATQPK